MKKFLYLGAVLALSACAPAILVPIQADADRVSGTYPGTTLADLTEGKSLYDANCGLCHELPKVNSRNAAGWNEIIPPMVGKANKKAGKEVISAAGQEKILRYVVAMCNAPKRK